MKQLIVNADDFGRSFGVNRGIVTAHEHGIVSSASLMVRWSAAAEAARYARERPRLGLGLHFDAGEWAYRDGAWTPAYTVVDLDDGAEVEAELGRQLDAFRALVGRPPSHLDSHQHVHLKEPVRSIFVEAARILGVVLRGCDPAIRYRGDFYGQDRWGEPLPGSISVEHLLEILATLPPGATELGCHPGEVFDLESVYRDERAREVEALCDSRVRRALVASGIELCAFGHVSAPRRNGS